MARSRLLWVDCAATDEIAFQPHVTLARLLANAAAMVRKHGNATTSAHWLPPHDSASLSDAACGAGQLPARQPEARPSSFVDGDHALDAAARGGGAGAISRNGRQQCLGFWVDCALGFRMRGRHLRRKHPTFVTHFNREDQRPLIVHSGRYQSGDCLRHQKILQFGMAGSLAGARHLHGIFERGQRLKVTTARQRSDVAANAAQRNRGRLGAAVAGNRPCAVRSPIVCEARKLRSAD